MSKEKVTQEEIKTTSDESVFKDTKTPDRVLDKASMEEKMAIVKNKKVPFKCEVAYNALYPNGFETTYQGIQILLIFDGRTVQLSEGAAAYVKNKIEQKAIREMEKTRRNANPQKAQEFLGSFMA